MIAAFQRRPLVFSLAVLAAVLVVIVAIELALGAGPRSLTPDAKRASAVEAKLLPPVVAVAPEQAYPELATRPLFAPTRRPAPEAAAVAKSTFVPGQYVLQGVIAAGDTRIAMLREKANGRIHRVERGREVNGIQVAEIEPETVTLEQGGEKEVLTLQVQRPAGTAPAAAQAGPFAVPAGAAATAVAAQPAAAEQPATPGQTAPVASRPGPLMFPSRPPSATPATPATAANPVAREPTAAPMSPEELLARRRARRQQTQ